MAERLRAWVLNHDDSWIFIILYVGLAVVLSLWISLFWLLAVVAGHFVLEWIRQRHIRDAGVLPQVFWELKLDIALILFALVLTLYLEVVFGILGLQAAGRAGAIARVGARGGSRFAAWERTLRGLLLSADDAAQVARAIAMRRASNDRASNSGGATAANGGGAGVSKGGGGGVGAIATSGGGAGAAAAAAVVEPPGGGEAEGGAQQEPVALVDAPAEGPTAKRALDRSGGRVGEANAARWGSWTRRWSRGDRFAVGLGVACIALILLAPWLTGHDYASVFATLGRELRPFPITVPLSGAP